MEKSELSAIPGKTVKVPVGQLTADYLINEKGFDSDTAEQVANYAGLFTASSRVVDDVFLTMFQAKQEALRQQGIAVNQETVVENPDPKIPPKKYFGPDWQRGTAYVPRGQRGETGLNSPIIQKSFIITKIQKPKM